MAKRAIISVHDKNGIVEFAKALVQNGYEIISTGGTYKTLVDAGVDAIEISKLTGFEEIMDGRVKTLHPIIHAGILARPTKEHEEDMRRVGANWIDMVVINLYPFQATVDAGKGREDVIENIDIGGPSMIRAACKNHERVAVVTDPSQFDAIIEELSTNKELSYKTRFNLARQAFHVTALYDSAIANYFDLCEEANKTEASDFVMGSKLVQTLRYGENPHQSAAFFRATGQIAKGLGSMQQLCGKELSYNNLMDMNSALAVVSEFDDDRACVSIVKHNTPCGVAVAESVHESYLTALESDSTSAFGGIVAFNKPVDALTANEMSKLFLEVIIAPEFCEEAIEILTVKANLRLVKIDMKSFREGLKYDVKGVSGGYLVQDCDLELCDNDALKVVTKRVPSEQEMDQLMCAWKVVKHVKSNAIVLWKDNGTIGVGAGQMNRVGAAKIAIDQAKEKAKGSYLASDAYFPFADSVEQAHNAGVTAIIQPGGSIRDKESIEACDKYGIAMVFTGMRHFRH